MLTPEQARALQGKRKNRRGGRPPAAGRPLRAALEAGITTAEVVQQLTQAIRDGKPWAIALFFNYCYGKPTPSTDDPPIQSEPDPQDLTDDELAVLIRAGRSPRTATAP